MNNFILLIACIIASSTQQEGPNAKKIVREYILDVQNDSYTIDSLIDEYYPSVENNQDLRNTLKSFYQEKRNFLHGKNLKKLIIKKVEREDQIPQIKGLKWQEGVYVVYLDDIFLTAIYLEEGRIVSSILMTKGDLKYFLKV